jgi:hypothetical protein
MKVSLPLVAGSALAIISLAILSNAPAKAEMRCYTTSNTTTGAAPCPKIAKSYVECVKMGIERGWDRSAIFYACNTQDYKN